MSAGGAADARAAHDRATCSTGRTVGPDPDGLPERPDADARRAARDVHRRVLARASRGSDTTWLGHRVDEPPTDLFAYQELVAAGPARLDHRDRHRQRRARRCSSRRSATCSATARSSRSTRSERGDRPSTTRITYVDGQRRIDDDVGARCASSSATVTARGSSSSVARGHQPAHRGVRALRAARAGRLLRGRREHDRQRPPGLARLRPRPAGGRAAASSPRTATSSTTPRGRSTGSRSTPAASCGRVRVEPISRRFFFVHLQKTAGTALWRRLQAPVRRGRRCTRAPATATPPRGGAVGAAPARALGRRDATRSASSRDTSRCARPSCSTRRSSR